MFRITATKKYRVITALLSLALVVGCATAPETGIGDEPALSATAAEPPAESVSGLDSANAQTERPGTSLERVMPHSARSLVPPGQLLVPIPLLNDDLYAVRPQVEPDRGPDQLPLPELPDLYQDAARINPDAEGKEERSDGAPVVQSDRTQLIDGRESSGDQWDDAEPTGIAGPAPSASASTPSTSTSQSDTPFRGVPSTSTQSTGVVSTSTPDASVAGSDIPSAEETTPSWSDLVVVPGELVRTNDGMAGETPESGSVSQSSAPVASEGATAIPATVIPTLSGLDAQDESFGESQADRYASIQSGRLSVVLPGSGWLYVGDEGSVVPVRLVSKQQADGNDLFEFDLSGEGTYRLWFQQQDSQSGDLHNERLVLQASPNGQTRTIVVADLPSSPVPAGSDEDPATVDMAPERLASLQISEAEDPIALSPEAIRARALDAENASQIILAREYWIEYLDAGGVEVDDTLARIYSLSVESEDVGLIVDAMERLPGLDEIPREDIRGGVVLLADSGRSASASVLLDAYVDKAEPDAPGDDAVIFRLAQSLEALGPDRDLARSLELYDSLMEWFPFSRFFEPSRERAAFLKRHYFEVR